MEQSIGLKVHDDDNVATLFCDSIGADSSVTVLDKAGTKWTMAANQAIPYGHKIALTAIAKGENIYKYGEVIGTASTDIAPGDYVHVHNLESTRGRGDLSQGGR